jgi:hypothetical protein
MAMVGHKTEAIYRRYAITDEGMLREGAARLAALAAQRGMGRKVVALRFPIAASGEDSGPVGDPLVAKLVAWDGIEPPTRGFSVRCSTS